jgi:Ser/Thr protein kinase RdoA (MazF antagonist)
MLDSLSSEQVGALCGARKAPRFFMHDELKDLPYYLAKAEDYRGKARVVQDPKLKAALEAIARECMARAFELDPSFAAKKQ